MPLSTRRIATAATALAMSLLGPSGFGGAATASAADADLSITAVGGNSCQDPETGRILDYLVEVKANWVFAAWFHLPDHAFRRETRSVPHAHLRAVLKSLQYATHRRQSDTPE